MSQTLSLSRVFRHPVDSEESLESSALVVGAAAFIVSGVVAAFVFWGRDLEISGRGSLGEFVGFGAAIAAFVVFVLARLLLRTRSRRSPLNNRADLESEGRLHWFDLVAIALAHAVIALLAWIGLAALLEMSFEGAVVFSFSGAVLAGVAIAVTTYVVYLSAVRMTPMLLSLVLAAFVVVGALASMLSSTDPLWWKKNLSTLGISDDISALAFNLTLIIAGVMVTVIAHYATAPLPARTPSEIRGRRLVRWGLSLIGILLACVGLFPVDEFLSAHNLSATGMAIIYVSLVIALPHLIPSIPRVFVLLGYVFVAVIVVIAIFFVTGYYNLTAVELVAFVLIFSWLIVFLRNTGTLTGADTPAAVVQTDADKVQRQELV